MADKIICASIALLCAAMFYSIGAIAQKSEKPMGFWTGREVDPASLTDVTKYNRENVLMWKGYSLWYAAAALAGLWNPIVFMIILIFNCTAGLALLIMTYNKILKKYSK